MGEEGASDVPVLECDLVMKGGVTSGIVYPAAIAAIASQYRLKSIGGTSAGAVGAAAAAAMEFGRLSERNPASRESLAGMAAKLGAAVDKKPLLLRLFEPDPGTARLFRLLMQVADRRKSGSVVWSFLRGPLCWAGLVVGLACIMLLAFSPTPLPLASALALFLVLLFGVPLLALVFLGLKWAPVLRQGLRAMVANGFGLCSGMARYQPAKGDPAPSLSAWLHEQFQSLAGLPDDEPLTFGDLWAAKRRRTDVARDVALAAATGDERAADRPELLPRDIDLALVASDINRARSVQLPFMHREDRLYARISDLGALFSPAIVSWMVGRRRPFADDELSEVDLGGVPSDDLIRLPAPADLPVLFAVRMSLSFPFLFRAVRLYIIRRRSGRPAGTFELAELWLADGGLTSNFPIHLFDAPVPSRPTFCLNLLYHDDELEPDQPRGGAADAVEEGEEARREEGGLPTATGMQAAAQGAAGLDDLIYMLRTNQGRLSAYTRFVRAAPLTALMRYGGRIVTTARTWGDNQLIDVPGYRDRIVHIRMLANEGGFNFDMTEETISGLEARGARAGEIIATRFHPKTVTDSRQGGERLDLNWANHRQVRFRSFLAGLEVMSRRFAAAWRLDQERAEHVSGDPRQIVPSLEQIAEDVRPGANPFPPYVGYRFRADDQANMALEMVKALVALDARAANAATNGVDFWNGRSSSPRPKSALKLRPAPETDALEGRP